MKGIIKRLLLTMTFICVILILVACGEKIKYCKVEGCPAEVYLGHTYCYGHKCQNSSCENRAVSYGYCEKCLERAQ